MIKKLESFRDFYYDHLELPITAIVVISGSLIAISWAILVIVRCTQGVAK